MRSNDDVVNGDEVGNVRVCVWVMGEEVVVMVDVMNVDGVVWCGVVFGLM